MISYEPLRKLLKERNLTGFDFDTLMGKELASRLFIGNTNLSTDMLGLICDKMKCNVEDVCCYTSEKPKLITKHHIDWEYMRQCAAEKEITFYRISKQLKGNPQFLTDKMSHNAKMNSEDLQSVADILGHKPEEFIID